MTIKLKRSPGSNAVRLCTKRLLPVLIGSCFFFNGNAQQNSTTTTRELKKLSVEELMNVEVTSISMRPEKLTEVASAVQVITGAEIQRSGATRLPEVLRLVSNLQVAQANSHDWAVTARGFNGLPSAGGVLANKLLVMIDGRSVYNPLFGGVYWDVQNLLVEDIDRIEVVSGPGGTLWGPNAVNGVINIITKNARDTQGFYASAAAGSFLKDMAQVRYGTALGEQTYARAYAQRMDQRNTFGVADDKTAKDRWGTTQAGFRIDASPGKSADLTVQGDFYKGTENDSAKKTNTDGQNVIIRYSQNYQKGSLMAQVFFDRTWRDTPDAAKRFYYQLLTYDGDLQYRFSPGKRHVLLSGIAYRLQQDKAASSLVPLSRTMPLYSGFVQDEISLIPNQLKLIVGSKFLHNVFSGFEVQPTGRIAWTPNVHNTIWTAVSGTVRVPTRFDSDVTVTPQKFDSEKVTAYELGYRMWPIGNLTLSFASFFNTYRHLRSLDSTSNSTQPIILANSQKAESWGVEISGKYQVTANWLLRGGYTYFDKTIWAVNPRVLEVSKAFEGVDYRHYCIVQSVFNLSTNWQFDIAARYFSSLPGATAAIPAVPHYFTFDTRLAWKHKFLELSIVGQNLAAKNHTETGVSNIPRTIYGRLTCRM